MASSSNATNPGDSAYPSALSNDPTQEPTPSTRQDLPPNNDAAMHKHEQDINPTLQSSDGGSVSKGTASVGSEGDVKGDKSMKDKIKETLTTS